MRPSSPRLTLASTMVVLAGVVGVVVGVLVGVVVDEWLALGPEWAAAILPTVFAVAGWILATAFARRLARRGAGSA